MFLRDNAKLIALGTALFVFGMATPAVATTVQRALFADNADKVDGRHAVGAAASLGSRAGKLVATGSAGRLPNNIIAKAPDASKLNGFTHESMRVVNVAPVAMAPSNAGVAPSDFGLTLPFDTYGYASTQLIVPPDHQATDAVRVDAVFYTVSACPAVFTRFARIITPGTGSFNGAELLGPGGTGGETQTMAPGYSKITYTLAETAAPGTALIIALGRQGNDVADTCGEVYLVGLQVRY